MIDATYLKANRTAPSSAKKKGAWPQDWSHKGGMNTKLHAICNSHNRTLNLLVSES